jgi:hypothetical protein
VSDTRKDPPLIDLPINVDTVCHVVVKARQFDVKEGVVEPDNGGNQVDDIFRSVLEDTPDDPTYAELRAFIRALSSDDRCALIALMWIGRGDYGRAEWNDAVDLARREHEEHAADYLLGTALLPDLLEEGLAAFDETCTAFERDHL